MHWAGAQAHAYPRSPAELPSQACRWDARARASALARSPTGLVPARLMCITVRREGGVPLSPSDSARKA
eukprot:11101062-Alexandrium_andersonii.AAC.1